MTFVRVAFLSLLTIATTGCWGSKSAPSTGQSDPATQPDSVTSDAETVSQVSPPRPDDSNPNSGVPTTTTQDLRRSDWAIVERGRAVNDQTVTRPSITERPRGLSIGIGSNRGERQLILRRVLAGDFTIDLWGHFEFHSSYAARHGGQNTVWLGLRSASGDDLEAALAVPLVDNREVEHHFRFVRSAGELSIEINGQPNQVENASAVGLGHLFFGIDSGMQLIVRRYDFSTAAGASPPRSRRNASDRIVNVGGRIGDIVAAADGELLVASMADQNRLAVIDVAAAELVGEVRTGQKPLIAASRERLIVVSGEPQRLDGYSLRPLKRLESETLPSDSQVRFIAAGCASKGPLMVVHRSGDAPYAHSFCRLDDFRPQVLREKHVKDSSSDPDSIDWNDAVSLRASPDGSTFVAEAAELYTFRVLGDELTIDANRNRRAFGPSHLERRFGVALSGFGARIHYSHGVWENDEARAIGAGHDARFLASKFVVPSVQGTLWAEVPWYRKTEVGLMPTAGDSVSLRRLVSGDEPQTVELNGLALDLSPHHFVRDTATSFNSHTGGLAADKRLFVVSKLNCVATVPASNDRVAVRRFELEEPDSQRIASRGPLPPVVVSPGETVEVQVNFDSPDGGVRVQPNGSQPPGFSVSTDGVVKWEVPTNWRVGELRTSVLGKDSSGRMQDAALRFVVSAPAEFLSNPFWQVGRRDEKSIALGGTLADIAIAAGGDYLVIHQPTQRRIRVFDTNKRDWVGHVHIDGPEILLAAGKERFIAYEPSRNRLLSWRLPSLSAMATAKISGGQRLLQIGMGSRTTGPLYVVAEGENRPAAPALYDATTLEPSDVDLSERFGQISGIHFEKASHLRVSGDGRYATLLAGKRIVLYQRDLGIEFFDRENLDDGVLMIGPYGERLFGSHGVVNLTQRQASAGVVHTIPSVESHLYLVVGPPERRRPDAAPPNAVSIGGLDVRRDRDVWPVPGLVAPITTEDFLSREDAAAPHLAPDQRMIFLPRRDLLITTPKTNDRLVLATVRVAELRGQSDREYVYIDSPPFPAQVAPSDFVHQFHVASKGAVTYRLMRGPPEASMTPDGKLTWKVSRGDTDLHRFIIRVSGPKNLAFDRTLHVRVK